MPPLSRQERAAITRVFIQRIRDKGAVPFVGAGVSANSKLPTWDGLIRKLAEEIGRKVPKVLTADDYLDIPELYYKTFREDIYYEKLAPILGGDFPTNPLHRVIFDLAGSRSIITTNFDRLLERYAEENNLKHIVRANSADLRKREKGIEIYKAHGDIGYRNIVLRRSDYDGYLESNEFSELAKRIRSELITNQVLFIGYRVADPDIQAIYKSVMSVVGDKAISGYMLEVGSRYSKEYDESMEARGIKVLFYSDIEKDILGFVRNHPDEFDKRLSEIGKRLYNFLRFITDSEAAIITDSEAAIITDSEAAIITDSEASSATPSQEADIERDLIDEAYALLLPFRDALALTPELLEDVLGQLTDDAGVLGTTLIITGKENVSSLKKVRELYETRKLLKDQRDKIRSIVRIIARSGIDEIQVGSRGNEFSFRLLRPLADAVQLDESDTIGRELVHSFKLREAEAFARGRSGLHVQESNVRSLLHAAQILMDVGEPIDAYDLLARIKQFAQDGNNSWLEFIAWYNMQTIARLLWRNLFYYPNQDGILRIHSEMSTTTLEPIWSEESSFAFRRSTLAIEGGIVYSRLKDEMEEVIADMQSALDNAKRQAPSYHSPSLIDRARLVTYKLRWLIEENYFLSNWSATVRSLVQQHCKAHFLQYATEQVDISRAELADLVRNSTRIHEIPYAVLYDAVTNFDTQELIRLFDDANITSFRVSEDVRESFVSAFVNILDFATNVDWRQRLFFLNNYLPNFFVILARIELESSDVDIVLDSVVRYEHTRKLQESWLSPTAMFINRQRERKAPGAIDSLAKFLYCIVHDALRKNSAIFDRRALQRVGRALVRSIQSLRPSYKLGKDHVLSKLLCSVIAKWNEAESHITSDLHLNILLPIYPLAGKGLRAKIGVFVRRRLLLEWWNESPDVFYFAAINGVIEVDLPLAERYLNSAYEALQRQQSSESDVSDDRRFNAFCGQIADLQEQRLLTTEQDSKGYLRLIYEASPYLQFVSAPLEFDLTKLEWRWLVDAPSRVFEAIALDLQVRTTALKTLIGQMEAQPENTRAIARVMRKLIGVDNQ